MKRREDHYEDEAAPADEVRERRTRYDAPVSSPPSRGIERDEHGFPIFAVSSSAPEVTAEMVARALEG